MTTINYSDLCAYVAAHTTNIDEEIAHILGAFNPPMPATAENILRTRWVIIDVAIEDYCTEEIGLISGPEAWKMSFSGVCAGQPKEAPCWKMRGYN